MGNTGDRIIRAGLTEKVQCARSQVGSCKKGQSQELKTSRILEASVRILAFILCVNGTYFNGFEQQVGILCLTILTGSF